jgi:hypothetical protein
METCLVGERVVHLGCTDNVGYPHPQMLYLLAVVGNTKEPALALAAGEVIYHLAQDLGAHFISLNRLLKEHPKLELVASEVMVTFIQTLSCGLFLDSQVEGVAAATADTLFYLVAAENDVWDKLEIRVGFACPNTAPHPNTGFLLVKWIERDVHEGVGAAVQQCSRPPT